MTGWRKRTIMEMAEQAGMLQRHNTGYDVWIPEYLEEFAELVRADEREACAKVCEDAPEPDGRDLAERIRARGQT
jgi:hypothetical protein